jgi:hypothetical protein
MVMHDGERRYRQYNSTEDDLARAPSRLFDHRVTCAGCITQERESDRPDETAGCIEDQEAPVRHRCCSGKARHHGAEERGESCEEDRATTVIA